jgi:tRNA(Arg) A34 adenosine deaminase TadA
VTTKQNITAIIKDRKGKILSIGKNSYTKTHTLQARLAKKVGLDDKIYLHSEIDAIVKCKNLDKAYEIFIYREGKNGRLLNAKPCPICQAAINATPIKIIQYTTGEECL